MAGAGGGRVALVVAAMSLAAAGAGCKEKESGEAQAQAQAKAKAEGEEEGQGEAEAEAEAEAGGLRARIAALAKEGVEGKWIVGAAIAVVRRDAEADMVFVGDAGGGKSPGPDTVFEIGSNTKIFTGLLLADLVVRGKLRLDRPAAGQTRWPIPVHPGSDEGPTLRQLSNHSSGLPRIPENLGVDLLQPYRDYDGAKLRQFLSSHQLAREPGTAYEYSNLAVGLLGEIVAEAEGTTFGKALDQRVLEPLGMDSTWLSVPAAERSRAAQGHNGLGKEVARWKFDALAGAGALRSSLRDQIRFARAQLNPASVPPLKGAIELTHQMSDSGERKVGLGWHQDQGGILWHSGMVGGATAYIGLSPQRDVAVIVLANTASQTVIGLGQAVLQMARGETTDWSWPR